MSRATDPFAVLRQAASKQRVEACVPDTPQRVLPLDSSAPVVNVERSEQSAAVSHDMEASRAPDQTSTPGEAVAASAPVPVEQASVDLRGDRPWWAAKDPRLSQGGFNPPVTIVVQQESGVAANQTRPRGATTPSCSEGFSLNLSLRPRALLMAIALIVIFTVSWHIASRVRSAEQARAHEAHVASVKETLDLMHTPAQRANAPMQAAVPSLGARVGAPKSSVLAAAGLTPTTIDQYLNQKLPVLAPTRVAGGAVGEMPRDVAQRGLPAVPAAAALSTAQPVTSQRVSSRKAPVGDRLDEPSPTVATRGGALQANARPAPVAIASAQSPTQTPDVDPLRGVFIESKLVEPSVPFAIQHIVSHQGGREAHVIADRVGGVAVREGEAFPNGWEVVRIEDTHVVFLSPEGRVERLPVSR